MGLGFQFSGALSRLSACRWQFYGLLAHAGLSRRRSLVATQCPLEPAAAGRRTASSYHISGYLGQRDEPSLFDYPFGGVEIHNTRALMEFIWSEYDGIRPTISPEEMANWLKEFHTQLAQALHNGEAVLDMVPE